MSSGDQVVATSEGDGGGAVVGPGVDGLDVRRAAGALGGLAVLALVVGGTFLVEPRADHEPWPTETLELRGGEPYSAVEPCGARIGRPVTAVTDALLVTLTVDHPEIASGAPLEVSVSASTTDDGVYQADDQDPVFLVTHDDVVVATGHLVRGPAAEPGALAQPLWGTSRTNGPLALSVCGPGDAPDAGAALPVGTYALRAASTVTRLGALRTDTVSTLATNAVGAASAGHVTDVRVARSEAVPFTVVGTA